MALGLLVPEVARIHWDDLTQEWSLKISDLVKDITGNFYEVDEEKAATLAQIISLMLQHWSSGGGGTSPRAFGAPYGDLAELAAFLGTFEPLSEALEGSPTPVVDESGMDDPEYAWPGSVDYPLPT